MPHQRQPRDDRAEAREMRYRVAVAMITRFSTLGKDY
jgi:hypothetical protein